MSRPHSHQDALSSSLQAAGGLAGFRSVAERPRVTIDGPLGPPKERAPSPTPVASHPAVEARRNEPQTVTQAPKPQPSTIKRAESQSTEPNDSARFSDKVTLPLTTALRDRSEELAKRLNRSRTIRKSRITSNSIIRVALEVFLDSFAPSSSHPVNSEEDLLAAARRKPR